MFLLPLLLLLLSPHVQSQSSNPSQIPFPSPPPSPPPPCPQVLPTPSLPRIVGGRPYQSSALAALHTPHGNFECTATLIHPRWLLTAAHCRVTSAWKVYLAGDAFIGMPFNISRVVIHPNPDSVNHVFDIAAIQLSTSAPFQPAFVNPFEDIPTSSSYARALGFGVHVEGGRLESGQLRYVDVPIIDMDMCKVDYIGVQVNLTSDMLCAGKKGCDACQGDSGGPLVQYSDKGEMIVIGIVSAGFGCAREGFPGIYTNVARFVPWLRANGVQFVMRRAVQMTDAERQSPSPSAGGVSSEQGEEQAAPSVEVEVSPDGGFDVAEVQGGEVASVGGGWVWGGAAAGVVAGVVFLGLVVLVVGMRA